MPKSLYKSLSDEDGNGSLIHGHDAHHIYKSIELSPAQFHEIVVHNNDPNSILTWDFDVVRSNLKFNVFRTDNKAEITGKFCSNLYVYLVSSNFMLK